MTDKVEVTQEDINWASEFASANFFTTRFNCARAVDDARAVIVQSGLLREHPEMLAHIEGLLEGVSVKVCEVLLEQRQIDSAAEAFARNRAAAEQRGFKRCQDAAVKVVSEAWGDGPSGSYDNGATADGWNMACTVLESAIRTLSIKETGNGE